MKQGNRPPGAASAHQRPVIDPLEHPRPSDGPRMLQGVYLLVPQHLGIILNYTSHVYSAAVPASNLRTWLLTRLSLAKGALDGVILASHWPRLSRECNTSLSWAVAALRASITPPGQPRTMRRQYYTSWTASANERAVLHPLALFLEI